jgi:hypothetical protein
MSASRVYRHDTTDWIEVTHPIMRGDVVAAASLVRD